MSARNSAVVNFLRMWTSVLRRCIKERDGLQIGSVSVDSRTHPKCHSKVSSSRTNQNQVIENSAVVEEKFLSEFGFSSKMIRIRLEFMVLLALALPWGSVRLALVILIFLFSLIFRFIFTTVLID